MTAGFGCTYLEAPFYEIRDCLATLKHTLEWLFVVGSLILYFRIVRREISGLDHSESHSRICNLFYRSGTYVFRLLNTWEAAALLSWYGLVLSPLVFVSTFEIYDRIGIGIDHGLT